MTPVEPRFLQIHTLTTYAASLLNRDDVGLAKRMPFGGVSRIRVSSQCLKRHWRRDENDWSLAGLGVPLSVRSRMTFEQEIAGPLIEKEGLDARVVRAILAGFQVELLGQSEKAKAAKADSRKQAADRSEASRGEADRGEADRGEADREELLRTNQVIILGRPEIDFIARATRDLAAQPGTAKDPHAAVKAYVKDREVRDNLRALAHAGGLDAALFGRMVTSDVLARGDAAVHVAHAFTVHGEEAENDYFSAVDDLVAETGALGSGHIGEAELTTGLFYGYVVVDVPLLVSNLTGCDAADWTGADRALPGAVIERLIHLIATVSPGAKRGSTAPYAWADLMLVEAGRRQPRTLANAFFTPVRRADGGGYAGAAVTALADHLGRCDRMYGRREDRRVAALMDLPDGLPAEPAAGLDDLAGWAAGLVRDWPGDGAAAA